jgi:hypothetical protein
MLLVPVAIWVAASPYLHAEDALFAVPLALRLAASPSLWHRVPVLLILLPWVVFPTWGALSAVSALGLEAAGIALMLQGTEARSGRTSMRPSAAT